jgi:Domain of unknown function (DUF5753)
MVLDEPSLFRLVGSAVVMAAQCKHLIGLAAMPRVTIQVLPSVAHPGNAERADHRGIGGLRRAYGGRLRVHGRTNCFVASAGAR